MSDFDCPNPKCGKKAPMLIAAKSGLGCSRCKSARHISHDGILHSLRLNKWGNRMTHADAMRIKTNKKQKDGTYKPDSRWR